MENSVRRPLGADDCSPLVEAEKRGEVRLHGFARGQYPGRRLQVEQLPGLRSIGYWDAVGRQTWGLPFHRNEGIEICYLLSGECHFFTDSGEWRLQAGDLTVTRPWQRHQLGNPTIGAGKLFWFILDVEAASPGAAWTFPMWVGPDAESRKNYLRLFRQNPRCHLADTKNCIRGFVEHSCSILDQEPSTLTMAGIAAGINCILHAVGERLAAQPEENKGDPRGFDQTIRQFYLGLESSVDKAAEPWTVESIAHACRVGKSYLTTACKRIFNTTPRDQLNAIRLQHAARLLRQSGDIRVTDVAFATGYNSSQYFARSFKKAFGLRPAEYRSGREPTPPTIKRRGIG